MTSTSEVGSLSKLKINQSFINSVSIEHARGGVRNGISNIERALIYLMSRGDGGGQLFSHPIVSCLPE